MARIRDYAVTEYGLATIASLVCNMPAHQTGDLLIHFSSKDGAVAINATSGWTAIQDGLTAGCAYRSEYKIAASSAETLTLVTGTAENFTVVVVAIEGAAGVSPIDVSAESAADDSAMPFDGPTASSTQNNALIFHAWFTDSGLSPTAYAPLVNLYCGDNGANSVGVAYSYKRAAGALGAGSWFGRGNDDGRGIVVAIKDDGSDTLCQAYSDPAISSGQVLRPLVGLSTMFADTWPTSLSIAALGNDFATAYTYTASYTDVTAALNNATASDVTMPTAVGNIVYFGSDAKFQAVFLTVATAGVAGVLAWEYWNGSAWVSTGVTGSNLLTTGGVLVTLTPVAVAAMSQTAVNSVTRYWLRARVTTLYTTAVVLTQGRCNGRSATYVVAAASADNGTNPYTDGASNAGSSTATTCAGFQVTFGAALDMDTGIIVGTFRGALKRDLAIDAAMPMPISGPGGLQVTLADTSGNYASYIVHANGAKSTDVDGRNVFAIDWNASSTAWGLRGSVNKSAVTIALFTSLGQNGAVAVVWSMLALVSRVGLAGGSSTYPLGFGDIENVCNNCIGMFPFFRRTGSAATIYAPLQLGGGDRLCLEVDQKTFQFPRAYDGLKYFDWNAGANVAGIKFYPRSGDVLRLTKCLFTSESPYRWEFDAASASSGWSGDFSGSTVVGATVTLRAVFTFAELTFIACPAFAQNGALLESCSFVDTAIACDDPEAISGCNFSSSGSGHALVLTSPGTYAFTGNQFSGYAASDGSTGNEAIYNNSGGAVTINVGGAGDTPSVRNGAGASTTVNNNVTVTLTGLKNPTEVRVFNAGSTTERSGTGAESVTGGTHAFSLPAATAVDISLLSLGYQNMRILNYSTTANATIPISQVIDRQYANP